MIKSFRDILVRNLKAPFSSYRIKYEGKGRILAIGDIHGCPKTLRALIGQVDLKSDDYLFFLGDFVNKGPDSVGALNVVLDLIHEGFQVFPLKGNHEQMVMEDYEDLKELIFYPEGIPLEKERNEYAFQEYVDFFYNLPYYYQIEDFILVHAGFNIFSESPFDDFEPMLWQRNFDDAGQIPQRIIHGHDSTYLPIIESAINANEQIINIDNGVTSSKWEKGHLLCLNLQNLELYKQACLDK